MVGKARLTEEQADACIKYYGAGDESKRREMKLREQTLSCEQGGCNLNLWATD